MLNIEKWWCESHYVAPDHKYITCEDFGHSDGMSGMCHNCLDMTYYQWCMCRDEQNKQHYLRQGKTEVEAIDIINRFKKNRFLRFNPDFRGNL